jgi:hypothetical protein
MLANQKALTAFASPDAGAANSLFTFLAQRLDAAYQLLDCANLVNLANPVSVKVNGAGVAVSATVNTSALSKIVDRLASQKSDDDQADSVDRERRSAL